MNASDQVWFVTGANKGIGAAITAEALANGYTVVAAARNPEAAAQKNLDENPNLFWVKLDLTDELSIQAAVKESLKKFGHIDVLINNAGYGCKSACKNDPL